MHYTVAGIVGPAIEHLTYLFELLCERSTARKYDYARGLAPGSKVPGMLEPATVPPDRPRVSVSALSLYTSLFPSPSLFAILSQPPTAPRRSILTKVRLRRAYEEIISLVDILAGTRQEASTRLHCSIGRSPPQTRPGPLFL